MSKVLLISFSDEPLYPETYADEDDPCGVIFNRFTISLSQHHIHRVALRFLFCILTDMVV